jgi:geranylgeranyl diphosphate synthase type II
MPDDVPPARRPSAEPNSSRRANLLGLRQSPGGHLSMLRALDGYKRLTLQTLLRYVPPQEPARYLYDLVKLYPVRGGKGFRPALCMATCVAFGGTRESALGSSVAIELFHNAFLVHDDIEDGSLDRRGEPTLHALHGVPIAVNVGDAMNVLSIRPLLDNMKTLGAALTWRVLNEIEHMVRESTEGQAMELGWVRDNVFDLGPPDYLRMILKKTCWYTCTHPMRIGALIGTRGTVDPSELDRFGYYLGAAFQIQDDLLNLLGDERKYGKEIGGDIWEGKRTLMLIHLMSSARPADRRRLRRFLGLPRLRRSAADVRWVMECLDHYGSFTFARSASRNLAGAALREYNRVFGPLPDSEEKRFLRELILYMIERDL